MSFGEACSPSRREGGVDMMPLFFPHFFCVNDMRVSVVTDAMDCCV